MKDIKIVYRGLPFKLMINGIVLNWRNLITYIIANRGIYLDFDGWKFSLDYGILYIIERRYWSYYIPPSGLEGKMVLSVGGGCGEDAKFFLDNGAKYVHVIENNLLCEKYLEYNRNLDNRLSYEIKNFQIKDLKYRYDLIKLDIEGYEMLLIDEMNIDLINKDIILESHCNYITDKFLEKGFKLIKDFSKNKAIHGGVVQLCRWKR